MDWTTLTQCANKWKTLVFKLINVFYIYDASMILREFIPDALLQKYLHRFWIASGAQAMPAEKCVLDGFVKLFIFLNDNLPEYYDTAGNRKEWGDGIGGHQTDGDLMIRTPAGLKLVFCIFKPAGFYRLFGIPIHLLNNNIVPLEVFLGSRTREFKESVLAADGDEARIRAVNDFFISLVRKLPETYTSVVECAHPIEAAYVGRAWKNLKRPAGRRACRIFTIPDRNRALV
jgi:hypothetical protein